MDLMNLAITTVLGAGGGYVGNMLKGNGLGMIGNLAAGALGGNGLGAVLPMLMGGAATAAAAAPAAADAGGGMMGMVMTYLVPLIGGGAGSLIGGLFKKA